MLPTRYVSGKHKFFMRNERSLLPPFLQLSYESPPLGAWDALLLEVVRVKAVVDDRLFDPFQQIVAIFLA